MSTDRRERMRQLLLAVQNAEDEAYSIGLPRVGQALGGAKTAVGWEIAGNPPVVGPELDKALDDFVADKPKDIMR